MSQFLSPLRYPGGKSKLAPYIKKVLEVNNLDNICYFEPFCGGSGVALELLFSNLASEIHINDYDRSIYSFWYSVINSNDDLCRMIKDVDINIDEWYKQKEIQDNKYEVDLLTLGFSTFFLNRTNRSGIMKGGVMGGINQNGKYKMDCRFNKDNLIKRIKDIYKFKDQIYIYNLDAIDFINYIEKLNLKNKFIYFDPPYYEQGSSLYVNFYNHNDHLNLSTYIKSIYTSDWILTYDNVDKISNMYKELEKETYTLSYTLQKKYMGKEIIIYSPNIRVPN